MRPIKSMTAGSTDCQCEACDTTVARWSVSDRFRWMYAFGLLKWHRCTAESSLASRRLAWLMVQERLHPKSPNFPMPGDPQPEFWPVRQRKYKDNRLIGRVKDSFRIEDIARLHTKLTGVETLKGRCFLHGETKGEAFTVWVDEQKWYCFGSCGIGGDVIDLVRALKARGMTWMKS